MTSLLPEHFERWLAIFGCCLDDLFIGETVELLKSRAAGIAGRMMENLGRRSAIVISAAQNGEEVQYRR